MHLTRAWLAVSLTLMSFGGESEGRSTERDKCLNWNQVDVSSLSSSSGATLLAEGGEGNEDKGPVRIGGEVACRALVGEHFELGRVVRNVGCMLIGSSSTKRIFEVARRDPSCVHFWNRISYDVNPLNPNALIVGNSVDTVGEELAQVSFCRHDLGDGSLTIGRMHMTGQYFGHCSLALPNATEIRVGGGYESMSAFPIGEDAEDADDLPTALVNATREVALYHINERIDKYLSKDDTDLIARVSGHPFQQLIDGLNDPEISSDKTLQNVLSMKRFIPHDLNLKGLSLLRSLHAERMTDARRRLLGLHRHPDAAEFEKHGVLLKDFDYYADPENEDEFRQILMMAAASDEEHIPHITWVEKNVTSEETDPQTQAHIDTFHPIVKMWVYEKGVVNMDTGPLHFMRGSGRNTEAKLKWLYNVTIPPAIEAQREPSLRYNGDPIAEGLPDILRPVLPLPEYKRTLIIADTSSIHHRGKAIPGTVRHTIRVRDGLQGGIPRRNPYDWEGWDSWDGPHAFEEYSCSSTHQCALAEDAQPR